MPLLPTTNVYVRPPRQTSGAGDAPGHERAQTGSGESAIVTVRSTPGFTVVSCVAVVLVPVFLMLPVPVPVPMSVPPADAMTLPETVIRMFPPAFSVRAEHCACGAAMVQPPVLP